MNEKLTKKIEERLEKNIKIMEKLANKQEANYEDVIIAMKLSAFNDGIEWTIGVLAEEGI